MQFFRLKLLLYIKRRGAEKIFLGSNLTIDDGESFSIKYDFILLEKVELDIRSSPSSLASLFIILLKLRLFDLDERFESR